ncbi:carbohydrate ABC transporter permease [Subtercola boreus]|uniref:Sugar ABC transporter permease n=1 Tax=Subtercola boreus TaxID=120213 RepID=A0A3E0W670_9MICO|nr:carbohydrate ABC transporter permease [Subtercola boreus]RFA17552.1 sugar ABC transporter permease [Subtercola boreus]RFA17602.1 sugar ABC transporter permease [Subtercola boreus]RFA24193.1 sugar ABC transporter permease [Subtercola boreus]
MTAILPRTLIGTSTPEKRTRVRNRKAWLGVLAWVIALVAFAPIAWMILTSFHSETTAATNPPSLFAPWTFEGWASFFGAETGVSPLPYFINSAVTSLGSTLIVLILATPAAYALSIRPVKKWSDVMFFFLTTKMLPMVAGLLPIYLIAKQLGLLDTTTILILVYTSMNIPIAVWMMRSFLQEIPAEILEAAEIDGAGFFFKFVKIIIPLASPGLAATALICFIFSWNELLFANALTSVSAATAPVFLTSFITSRGLFLAKVCAASFAVSLPVLIAGFAAQDKLVQGLSLGSVK